MEGLGFWVARIIEQVHDTVFWVVLDCITDRSYGQRYLSLYLSDVQPREREPHFC